MEVVAAVEMALSVAQTLLSALHTSNELSEICSMFQVSETQLEGLKSTMEIISKKLLDVEMSRQELTNEDQVWVEKFKDAVYDVDDFFDEFNTHADRLRNKTQHASKLNKKVRKFCYFIKNFVDAPYWSREIKYHADKFGTIAKNKALFGSRDINKQCSVKIREETSCVISSPIVIGREKDQDAIVNMLLSSEDQNVSYVSIVGTGGMGKTTLAQLVYHDKRVKRVFLERIWVCVSEDFGVKQILEKIIGRGFIDLQTLQREVRTLLQSKKYLLVLDDVWNDDNFKWLELEPYLVSDVSGSKIIVTTRSKDVANAIGQESITHELEGLSKEDSWSLFKRIAFRGREEDQDSLDKIGKDIIVKKCANVPLSIRVIASWLHDQDKSQWQLFSSFDLAEMCRGNKYDRIMSTLMFSYYNLPHELKSCFSFCSLFPKDYILQKKDIINMWLAQGFLVPTHDGQSIEDIGERYFTILLNRCFFQDIKMDDRGHVYSCKMHDLMHDLAVEVAGKESLALTSIGKKYCLGKTIRHLSTDYYKFSSNNLDYLSEKLRTYISLNYGMLKATSIVSSCKRLRVLSLCKYEIQTLPDTVGKLLHLRYLDLSENKELEMLPKSIAKLHNLQTLKLTNCKKLKELPEDTSKLHNLRILMLTNCENLKDLPKDTSKLHNLRILMLTNCKNLKELPEDTSKLVNLRTLDIYGCESLTHMPRGMNNLKNLHTLPLFVVGGVDSKQVQGSKLVELQALTRLKGDLYIKILEFSSSNMPCATEKAFLLKAAHNLDIKCCNSFESEVDQSEVHETLVEELCPNDDVRRIKMFGYEGKKMPSWASMIVSVKLSNIKGLQKVTSLSQLCHLKVVELEDLPNVEYIESHEAWAVVSTPNNNNSNAVFFPVLEKLVLKRMQKLKGWWSEVRWEEMGGVGTTTGGCMVDATGDKVHAAALPFFPLLHELDIEICESMMYFPPCPHVKRLQVVFVNEALTFCMTGGQDTNALTTCSTSTSIGTSASASSSTSESRSLRSDVSVPASLCLEKLITSNERVMNSVLKAFVGGAIDIDLWGFNDDMERMGIESREGFERCASSLQHLTVSFSKGKMRGSGIDHLTNLQSLEIFKFSDDELGEENEEPESMPWKNLQSLSSLKFRVCKKMVKLPKGLRYLGTSLQSLSIGSCPNMEELGECIGFLTSLQSLRITGCVKLKALPESLQFLTSLQLLRIRFCFQLKSLPEAMRHLTSLTTLDIVNFCDELRERCRKPDGQDWSKICHIPNIKIR